MGIPQSPDSKEKHQPVDPHEIYTPIRKVDKRGKRRVKCMLFAW